MDSYDSDNPCPADLGELVDQALDMMCSRPDFKPGRILDQLEYHGDRSLVSDQDRFHDIYRH